MTESDAAGYVAGLIDGEGHVALHRNRRTGRIARRAVIVCNTEPDIVDGFVAACEKLGLRVAVYGRSDKRGDWSYRWDVHITGRDQLERLNDLITLRSARKRTELARILESYTERQRRWQDIDTELLRELYEDRGWSYQRLATHFGVKSLATISRWIKRAGITPRPKGAHHGLVL